MVEAAKTHTFTLLVSFNFLALSTSLLAGSSSECICIGVCLPLAIFSEKIVLLEMNCLSFHVLETKEPGQGRLVGPQVKSLPIEVFVSAPTSSQ
jgi:hypothetical protein